MPHELKVVHANRSNDRTLRYLLEFYFHDLAEWFKFDQQPEGNYADSSEQYWREDCDVYLLYIEGIPIGFSIVGSADPWLSGSGARDMTEFFIVRRHRRTDVGRKFASYVWDLYPGPWLVRVFRSNAPALPFWRKVISEYSAGRHEELGVQKHDAYWSYFTFETRDA